MPIDYTRVFPSLISDFSILQENSPMLLVYAEK